MDSIITKCVIACSILASLQTVTGLVAGWPTGVKKPWFCHDLECPVYTVQETNSQFETRVYAESEWVATRVSVVNYTRDANRNMFFTLFHYISGNNSMHMKIPMTAPVVREVDPCQGLNCKTNYTEHFMMPFNLQSNPPMPTESGVFIRKLPAMTVYVRSYGGYGSDELSQQNLKTLVQDLQAANKPFNQDQYYTAGYDGPYAFIRHNEVWLAAISYGGYGSDELSQQNLKTLVQDLQAANKPFNQDQYNTTSYDGPYAFIRHNEVWLAAM